MSQEERTRDEVLNALVAHTRALTAVLDRLFADVTGPQPTITIAPFETGAKPRRAKKAEQAEAEAPTPPKPELPIPTVGEKMADIKPTKPGKTLADLRVALQECITKHGMPVAKERLQPYQKVSDVPDDALATVIEKLAA